MTAPVRFATVGVLREHELLAGAAGAKSAWLVASAIDWHWEMPAVTLPALMNGRRPDSR